jgi:hypothetical protein
MLSIRFNDKEWWVSGKHFDRLFHAAFKDGAPAAMEYFSEVANANGGIDFSIVEDRNNVRLLIDSLASCAKREIAEIGDVSPSTEDGSYRNALIKFLKITE